jgi:hypothetical protein
MRLSRRDRTVKVVPRSSTLATVTAPPWSLTSSCTSASPIVSQHAQKIPSTAPSPKTGAYEKVT